MKRVLYISNIEVPYRIAFFNELAKYCDLTVVYERSKSSNRDSNWTLGKNKQYKSIFLDGLSIGRESSFSLGIVKYLFQDFDEIIIGCYNTPMQMFSILLMKLFRRQYCINIDGETFIADYGLKSKLKVFFLKGAHKYFAAGEKCAATLARNIGNAKIFPYFFSSLTEAEIEKHSAEHNEKERFILVVGQYFDYKGMDVAALVAKMDTKIRHKFVGMGNRTNQFVEECKLSGCENVEVISFLQKADLEQQYKKAMAVMLPSRQECWGLVINEAASFGTPIISTWGSGAAVEFISDQYEQYLAAPNDALSLYRCVKAVLSADTTEYTNFLQAKCKKYSIENSAKIIFCACEEKHSCDTERGKETQ